MIKKRTNKKTNKNDLNLPPNAQIVPKHPITPRAPIHRAVRIIFDYSASLNRQKLHFCHISADLSSPVSVPRLRGRSAGTVHEQRRVIEPSSRVCI